MKILAIIFAIITGCCLAAIQLRKKLPFWGTIFSGKICYDIDKADKRLLFLALVAFVLCVFFAVIAY